MKDVILPELLSDNLSDVLRIFLIIVSVTAMILCEKEKLYAKNKVTVKVKRAPRKVTIVMILQMGGNHVGNRRQNA
jgi:hypothetical protein